MPIPRLLTGLVLYVLTFVRKVTKAVFFFDAGMEDGSSKQNKNVS
jgi:hypothetical protein